MALDIITTPTTSSHGLKVEDHGDYWTINGYEADASTAIAIKAAVAGKAHYLDYIVMSAAANTVLPHLQDEDDNHLFGPIAGLDFLGPGKLLRPIIMVANKALELKAAGAGGIFVFIQGRTELSG